VLRGVPLTPQALGFQSFSGFSFKPPKIEKGAEFLSPAPQKFLLFLSVTDLQKDKAAYDKDDQSNSDNRFQFH